MTTSLEPAPLFDLVTGFPPDDAVDLVVPMPLSLAVHMTMLEARGRAAELATLRRVHVEQARETVRRLQAGSAGFTEPASASARLRVTHLVDDRVPGVAGLRPHLHVLVGATTRDPGGPGSRLDVDALAAWASADLLPDHRDRLATATAERCGLDWGPTAWSPCELTGPPWLVERVEQARDVPLPCAGPWPRPPVLAGPA